MATFEREHSRILEKKVLGVSRDTLYTILSWY